MRTTDGLAVLFSICSILVTLPGAADAEGALAVGLPEKVEKDGVALGTSWNYDTRDGAEARALKECLNFMDAPANTRALCKVIRTFKKECAAIALDPKAGTPGVGWAIRPETKDAEAAALEECKKTAGKNRVKFCVVTTSKCDGK